MTEKATKEKSLTKKKKSAAKKTKKTDAKAKSETPTKRKSKKKAIQENTNKEFFPVLEASKDGEFTKTALPVETLAKVEVEDVTPNGKLDVRFGDDRAYQMTPRTFNELVVGSNIAPNNADKVRKEAQEALLNLKKAWVKLGDVVSLIHGAKLYKSWGFTVFCDYCEKELGLKDSTVYEMMDGVKFLKQYKPEMYKALTTTERSEEIAKLPSYHSLYLLERKENKLKDKDKLEELINAIFEEGVSTRELQRRLKEVLGKEEQQTEVSIDRILLRYKKILAALEEANLPKKLKNKAKKLFDEIEEEIKKVEVSE